MASWLYSAILAGCVVVTLPLEFAFGVRVYRSPARTARTVSPVVLVFGCWDRLAVADRQWWFADVHTLGISVLGLPIEEWLFFVVIPVCALLTYEAAGVVLHRYHRVTAGQRRAPDGR